MKHHDPASTQPKEQASAGRRNRRSHEAIISATLDLLKTTRYNTLTIEAIAFRAGVGKATVYRWWPSKGALVAEAVASTMQVEGPKETANFRADLIAAVEVSIRNYSHPPGGVLITALAADLTDDPVLLQEFLADFVLPRRTAVAQLLERGVMEGHIGADVDIDLTMDMWAGAVIYRCLMKHAPITDDFAQRLVDAVIPKLEVAARKRRRTP